MIVFRPAGFVKKRLKSCSNRKWLPSEEEESHHSDYSDAESQKVEESRKLAHEKLSGSLICKLIDEHEVCPCLWDIFYHAILSADLSAAIFVYNFTRWETRCQLATRSHRVISRTIIN